MPLVHRKAQERNEETTFSTVNAIHEKYVHRRRVKPDDVVLDLLDARQVGDEKLRDLAFTYPNDEELQAALAVRGLTPLEAPEGEDDEDFEDDDETLDPSERASAEDTEPQRDVVELTEKGAAFQRATEAQRVKLIGAENDPAAIAEYFEIANDEPRRSQKVLAAFAAKNRGAADPDSLAT